MGDASAEACARIIPPRGRSLTTRRRRAQDGARSSGESGVLGAAPRPRERRARMGEGEMIVDSPMGRRPVDRDGPPVGVGRVDPRRSYADIGGLLQRYINESDRRGRGGGKGGGGVP